MTPRIPSADQGEANLGGPADVVVNNPQTNQPIGGNTIADQAAAALGEAKLPDYLNTEAVTAEQDALEAMAATGRKDPGSISLPPGSSWGDFFALQSSLHEFQASAGMRYYPTKDQIGQMLSQGMAHADQATVFQWLAKNQGIASSMPWAAAGLTKTKYNASLESYAETVARFTGDPSMFADLQHQAIANSWSHEHVAREIQNNPAYNAKLPWLKHGMDFAQWKSFKEQNKNAAMQRFDPSGNITDSQYAQILNDNAPSRREGGGPVATQSAQTAAGGVGHSSQSKVR